MKVVTRMAPSPTGRLHVGTARTALFNFLFARHHGGRFLMRIEDTDRERSKIEYETDILEGLAWLGIEGDEVVRQSERLPLHTKLLQQIIAEGKAYISKEESKNEPGKTVEVVRLKNPGRSVTFRDEVRGDITFDTAELGDFVIARAIDDPLYHFAVVADDMDMGVTHIIRGEDHVSNTPRQILIQEALGAPRPVYVHLPLILDTKRAKLSKRSGTAVNVMDYREEGILPEALVNYLGLLGWNPGDEREDFTLDELVSAFTLEGIQKSGAAWDREKLLSVNQRFMRRLPDADFAARVHGMSAFDTETLSKTIPLLKDRARSFAEAREMLSGELSCLFEAPRPERHTLLVKEPEDRPGVAKIGLESVLEALQSLQEGVSPEAVKEVIMPVANAEEAKGKGGRGAVLWPLRYALSGQERSPDPFTLVSILGPAESISRIKNAIAILAQ